MSAEDIAGVVADLRAGRVRNAVSRIRGDDAVAHAIYEHASAAIVDPVVVDAGFIFQSILAQERGIAIYESHPNIAPPWNEFAVCHVNTFGNVFVTHARIVETYPDGAPWEPAEPVEWHRVRWVIETFIWLGGRSHTTGEPIATTGPLHAWNLAIYDDGAPADIHWVRLLERDDGSHRPRSRLGDGPQVGEDAALLTLLGALNFLNCRNIELVEPDRPRGERRRLERTGVKVHTLNVFPVGRTTRGAGSGQGVPLTSVRGHFASYGPQYDRKLLFGKYSGRFWISQHARGHADLGETDTDYRLRP